MLAFVLSALVQTVNYNFSLRCEWREALKFITILIKESKWSRCLYMYQKAAIMVMIRDELTFEEKMEMDNLMKYGSKLELGLVFLYFYAQRVQIMEDVS